MVLAVLHYGHLRICLPSTNLEIAQTTPTPKRPLSVQPFLSEFFSIPLLSCWWLFFICLFIKLRISLFLLVIPACVIICLFFHTLNLTFCSSSFYLKYFFLHPILSFFFCSSFLLYSLIIWTISSDSSWVSSFTFPCFLSSYGTKYSRWT